MTAQALNSLIERFDPAPLDVVDREVRIRLAVRSADALDVIVSEDAGVRTESPNGERPDTVISADEETWRRIASDLRGGMTAFRQGRLRMRGNLHVGAGFLAGIGEQDEHGLRFESVETRAGRISTFTAGTGRPVVCLHGLGGTKASFLTTAAALADEYRVIGVDLPGFGDSDKPILAAYDAPYFARAVVALLDELQIDRAHLVGNSMGGRVAIEAGLAYPARVHGVVLLSPALAWLRPRPLKGLLRLPLSMLGLIQPTPRAILEPVVRSIVPRGRSGWTAAGVDEFLRVFEKPRGRAAFYAALTKIYLDEPDGENGLWTRLAALQCESLFVWGRQDALVPIAFMKHVERTLPGARHVELDCGHVPQMEMPGHTHRAIREFFHDLERGAAGRDEARALAA